MTNRESGGGNKKSVMLDHFLALAQIIRIRKLMMMTMIIQQWCLGIIIYSMLAKQSRRFCKTYVRDSSLFIMSILIRKQSNTKVWTMMKAPYCSTSIVQIITILPYRFKWVSVSKMMSYIHKFSHGAKSSRWKNEEVQNLSMATSCSVFTDGTYLPLFN